MVTDQIEPVTYSVQCKMVKVKLLISTSEAVRRDQVSLMIGR